MNERAGFRRSRAIAIAAGWAGGLGVLVGAFGSHWLPGYLADAGLDEALVAKRLDQYEIGVRYHLVHAVALLALASLSIGSPRARGWIATLFVTGLCLFSGSLYVLVVTNTPWLGMITPLGGLAWIAAWTLLTITATRTPNFH